MRTVRSKVGLDVGLGDLFARGWDLRQVDAAALGEQFSLQGGWAGRRDGFACCSACRIGGRGAEGDAGGGAAAADGLALILFGQPGRGLGPAGMLAAQGPNDRADCHLRAGRGQGPERAGGRSFQVKDTLGGFGAADHLAFLHPLAGLL